MGRTTDVVAERARERDALVALARGYVERLAERVPVRAAVVVGSVARGDFNLWSDVDVVVVVDHLPERAPDRGALLAADAPARVQPVGFELDELQSALRKRNPLALEAVGSGVVLMGEEVFLRLVP